MRAWLSISFGLAMLQCGGIARTTGKDLCTPGAQIACECGRDIPGVRTCAADGFGYDACVCGGGNSTTTGTGTTSTGTNGSTGTGTMTTGTSGSTGAGGSTGTGGGGIGGAGGVPVQCTSKIIWTGGTTASIEMSPGRACIACHETQSKTQFTIAGTIFQGPHDADDCYGVDGIAVAVSLLDADNPTQEIAPRLLVNSAGNFYWTGALPDRYRVRIISQGVESIMQTPVTNGDCNACHTANGTSGASGRLIKP